jgi:hypothetical protein
MVRLDQWLENRKGAPAPTKYVFFRILLSADHGMISAETMAEFEARRLLYILGYILGVRERTDKLVRGADCNSRSATY